MLSNRPIYFSYPLLFLWNCIYFYFPSFANSPIFNKLSSYFFSCTFRACFSLFQPSSICSFTFMLFINFSSRLRYLVSHLSSWLARRSSETNIFLPRLMAFFDNYLTCVLVVSMSYPFYLFYLWQFQRSCSKAVVFFLRMLHYASACLRERYSASVMMISKSHIAIYSFMNFKMVNFIVLQKKV